MPPDTMTTSPSATTRPVVAGFFEKRTFSVQYVVSDPVTKRCAIIDPVHDFDEKSGATSTESADELLAYIEREGLTLEWILDTHPHADHFSAAGYLNAKTGVPTAIGAGVVKVQRLWKALYNLPDDFPTDGSQWDHLFEAGETFRIGSLDASVMFSPGHTLCSITYVIGDAAFVHDTLFHPDIGTARADFPGGDARALWHSIEAIMALPDETRIFVGHDYPPETRGPAWESTVAEQRAGNEHLHPFEEAAFVAKREERDATLPMPKLILHSLQVNIRGGHLPPPESNGKRYLKIPLDALDPVPWD
ncbi:MBL fold metallo-hydrolase [Acidiphilium acidophilum]|uniref:MBL fold metallo-hydrolase n=1 Tax=Acidiphilium acidophilum TaxID=76588 RepID=UPI002E8E755F|nr:MBL fold metallo-hydrolase [Acidiphilium acidophilum]